MFGRLGGALGFKKTMAGKDPVEALSNGAQSVLIFAQAALARVDAILAAAGAALIPRRASRRGQGNLS
jgi:hypothetical protein